VTALMASPQPCWLASRQYCLLFHPASNPVSLLPIALRGILFL